MKAALAFSIGALTALGSFPAQAAIFSDRASFVAALSTSFTDTYEPSLGYPNGFTTLTDSAMSAVVGETNYTTTGFDNNNLIFAYSFGQAYCGGCNGSFTLDFTDTSFGNSAGVFGVGVDVVRNAGNPLYTAFVTYGDGSTTNFGLPDVNFGGVSFLGLTSASRIATIAFGLPNGATTQQGSFIIDNLTIGSGGGSVTPVPEPASWVMLILGSGIVGAAMRRQGAQRRARVTVSYG